MKNNRRKIWKKGIALGLILATMPFSIILSGCGREDEEVIVLRVSNWEEYMDEGDWDEEDTIEFSDGTVLCPENGLVEDFEEWFYDTYGKRVKVEYSTFGTNEELYNQITIGDVYDLVCPSEYMIMKMMTEDMLEPYSESFFDENIEENYYVKGVSPYISGIYNDLSVNGEKLSTYAAGYMWGTLGIVYNPEEITPEQASSWKLFLDKNFDKKITIKDSVRDAFFAGVSIYYYDQITEKAFVSSDSYATDLSDYLNATDAETVDHVEDILSEIRRNVYSFETDSGKADMVTGKVVANQQWSGDAVYTMDQAEEDGVELCYAAPDEATNLWFDGWVMMKNGVAENPDKKLAAEAFVNYLSMPESAVRNMYYIGYTSVISGGDSDKIMDYINWCYEADPEEVPEEEMVEYDISYFFDRDAVVLTTEDQTFRQLYAQYPTEEVTHRSVVMAYFNEDGNERINRMWTNVRCFDLKNWLESIRDIGKNL